MSNVQVRVKGKVLDEPGYPFDIEVHYYLGEPPFVISFKDYHISRSAALQHLKLEVESILERFNQTFGVSEVR